MLGRLRCRPPSAGLSFSVSITCHPPRTLAGPEMDKRLHAEVQAQTHVLRCSTRKLEGAAQLLMPDAAEACNMFRGRASVQQTLDDWQVVGCQYSAVMP